MPQQSESVSGNEAKGLTPISAQTALERSTPTGESDPVKQPASPTRVEAPASLKERARDGVIPPDSEDGIFHLTQGGWLRLDNGTPPSDRLESWNYHLERPSSDAKDEVTLTRVWMAKNFTDDQSIALHARHGEAVEATIDRNVVLDCHV